MPNNVRIHVAAAASLLVLVSIIALFCSYPKLLVYLLLAVVALLAYGALYLILAAWIDPADRTHPDAAGDDEASAAPADSETAPEAAAPDVPPGPQKEVAPTEETGPSETGRKITP
jgi:hypothetical protein